MTLQRLVDGDPVFQGAITVHMTAANDVFTALGDAVNVAARLQDMTKGLACEAVVSDEAWLVADNARRAAEDRHYDRLAAESAAHDRYERGLCC